MKYVKLFEQFVNESGNAVDNVRPIKQDEVIDTAKWVEKEIFPQIGLTALEDDAAVIGSAGKKLPDQTSGDIDIAVSADKIAGFLGVPVQNTLFALNDKLKSLGYQTKMMPGFNQVSIAAPVGGYASRGYAQVDFMISTDLNWSRFIYHSPDFRTAESRYKGAYRNLLLMAAIGKSFFEVTKKTDAGETAEFQAYVVRLNQGIVQVRKSFEGKKGLLKTAALLKDYDKFVTNTPEAVVELLFKGKHTPKDIDTYEKLKSLIDSTDFKYPGARSDIYQDFEQKLEDAKLPMPENL
jgi:hypothetical protein